MFTAKRSNGTASESAAPLIPGPVLENASQALARLQRNVRDARYHDDVGAVEAEIQGAREADLPEDHDGGDTESDRDGELPDHQGRPQQARRPLPPMRPPLRAEAGRKPESTSAG